MSDWNAGQYLKFEDQRTRPASDLLAHVPLATAERCIDLGCGPGNSTELIVRRFPDAQIIGLDTSDDMLAKARRRLPAVRFEKGDIAKWHSDEPFDLIYANAAMQWVPDHLALLPKLCSFLRRGGCLAIQVPDNLQEPSHVLMRDVAGRAPWAARLKAAAASREKIGRFDDYYSRLKRAGCDVDLWRTTYVHPLDSAGAIVEWLKSTGLRPFIDSLDEAARGEFLAQYVDEIAKAYPEQCDGKVLLRFPRLFLVARRV